MRYPVDEWPQGDGRSARGASGEVGRRSAAPKRTVGAAGTPGSSPRQSGLLCSKCRREPRYPGQRWGKRCFAWYHANRRARQRREREGQRARDKATTYINRGLNNTRPPLYEQAKVVLSEVPKYRNRPELIRVSLLPWRGHQYIDIRVYLAGKPTRKGITIHSDLVAAVMEGMQRALQTSWDQWPAPPLEKAVPQRWQPNVHWPEGL
jgi:hypothetical protein